MGCLKILDNELYLIMEDILDDYKCSIHCEIYKVCFDASIDYPNMTCRDFIMQEFNIPRFILKEDDLIVLKVNNLLDAIKHGYRSSLYLNIINKMSL